MDGWIGEIFTRDEGREGGREGGRGCVDGRSLYNCIMVYCAVLVGRLYYFNTRRPSDAM